MTHPNLGPGTDPVSYARNIQILADLEVIRLNQFQIIQESIEQIGGNNTTSEVLTLNPFEAGYIYIITTITAYDMDDAAHQIRIGAQMGGVNKWYEIKTVTNAGDSVEYVGQLMLKETDQIAVDFRSVGANDTLNVEINGYKIRRGV